MQHDYLKHLVERYLEKKSTDEELEIFLHLMQQGKLDPYLRSAMDQDIQNQLEKDNQEAPGDETGPGQPAASTTGFHRKNYKFLRWPFAAAIAFMLLSLGYLFLQQRNEAIPLVRISNHQPNILKQVLPDGSTVWLNPNTTLTYPQKFGKVREVSMRGEAFFEVTKDRAHPFVINSGNIITKVWGTSFRIRAVEGESTTKVSVLTGKVSVTVPSEKTAESISEKPATDPLKNKEEIFLLPQQEVTYKAASHLLIKAPIPDSSDVIIWRKSALSFENTPLKTIAAELSKFYHVRLNIEGHQLQDNTLTADFTDKNLADILVLICKSVHTTYSKEDDIITLRTTIN